MTRYLAILLVMIFHMNTTAKDYYSDRILICLDKNISNINIQSEDGIAYTGFFLLDELFAEYEVTKMERYVTSAREDDIDGDIKLANIFAIYFSTQGRTINQAIASFEECPLVHLAEYEYIDKPDIFPGPYTPNDPLLQNQWYIERIQANWAWGIWTKFGLTPGDETIVLADVDSGVEWWHSDLEGNIWVNPAEDIDGDGVVGDFGPPANGGDEDGVDNDGNGKVDDLIGWDFVGADSSNYIEDNDPGAYPNALDHGTNVAGCLSGVSNNNTGIASTGFKVKIMVCKNGTEDGNGIFRAYDGVLYAARSGADVVNCSWGNNSYSAFNQSIINTSYNTYGAIIVASAGNKNLDMDIPGNAHYPSNYNNVMCVAGTNSDDSKSGGSNYGLAVDISSPYTSIMTTDINNGYESPSGTSFSSPIVASALGLLKSYFPNENNSWLENRLLESADNIDLQNPNYIGLLGAGRVNIYSAIGQTVYPSLTYVGQSLQIINDDGDGKLNPGEGATLRVTLRNEQLWRDVDSLWAVLRNNEAKITIPDSTAYYGSVNNGSIVINIADPFEFHLDGTTLSGVYTLDLYLKAAFGEAYYYETILPISIPVSVDQFGFPVENLAYIQSSPAIVIHNERNQIFTGSNGGNFYGFDSAGNTLENFPINIGGTMWGSPAVGDLDNNGTIEVVIGNSLTHLYVFDRQGNTILDKNLPGEAIYGTPSLVDLDNNNDLEIVFGTFGGNVYALDHGGTVWNNFPVILGTASRVIGGCAVGDLTGNGQTEIVVGTQDNTIYAIDIAGNILSGFPFSTDGRIQGSVLIADLDGGGTAGTSVLGASLNGKIYSISANGSLLWEFDTQGTIRSTPGLCDIDGNGTVEVFVGNDNGALYGINQNGTALSGFPLAVGESIESAPVFSDLDGDGSPELVVSTMSGRVHVYNFSSNDWQPGFPAQVGGQCKSTPQIIDLDGDGDLEITVGTNNSLASIDVKIPNGISEGYWNMFQGNLHRTGNYGDVVTGIRTAAETNIIHQFALHQNYPNPFNPETNITFSIPEPGEVGLNVYNILGQNIRSLFTGDRPAGIFSVIWDGKNQQGVRIASGVYFLRLSFKSQSHPNRFQVSTIKMLLAR